MSFYSRHPLSLLLAGERRNVESGFFAARLLGQRPFSQEVCAAAALLRNNVGSSPAVIPAQAGIQNNILPPGFPRSRE
jgi:hypothetical protein